MLEISDALSFFRLSCGRWTSQRSQHHLLHRRAEAGASFIVVEELLKGDERLAEIAERTNANVEQIIGGSWVRWSGSMAWDRDGERPRRPDHVRTDPRRRNGATGTAATGSRLRRKSAGGRPVPHGRRKGLILTTDYEMMSSLERFWFASENVRLRTSTVARALQQRFLLHRDPAAGRC